MPRGVPAAGFRKTKNWSTTKSGSTSSNVAVASPVVNTTPVDRNTIRLKLSERFGAMDKMTHATMWGKNKSLIISGPAGLGKSHGVMLLAEKYEAQGNRVTVIKGFVRPTGLYKALFDHRDSTDVVIFDDADSIFQDPIALNLLKAATDMTKKRVLSWRAETRMETEDGEALPQHFEFNGKIIFITNYDFDYLIQKGNMNSPHFQAMISRSIYLDLAIKTIDDYLVRIEQIAPMMYTEAGLDEELGAEISQFIEQNALRLRERSLRMVLMLIQLVQLDHSGWQQLARCTVFKSA